MAAKRMRQREAGYNNEGVEVDLYDGDDGSITVIHDIDHSRDDIMAASSSHSHSRSREALHNLNLSVIRKPAREVTFSNIKVRTYPICVGDNPACSDGVPLAIDWQYQKEYNFTVDYYERKLEKWANNPESPMHPNRYPRKTEAELRISAADRLQLLFSSGVMPPDANLAFRQVELVRRNREATIRSLHFWHMIYVWERIQRATRNATVGRASKKKERLMLQPYRNMEGENNSIEISVDEIPTPRRWFTFRQSDQNSSPLNNIHKRKKPAPIVLNQSYETASVATNTPQSIVSYNGDALFPPTPTSNSPLAKTIRERNMTQFEPRIIDMTGQVSGSFEGDINASPIARSPTMKRTNKPRDRGFDDDDSQLLIGESIMDQSMDYNSNVDRYATAQHNTSISSRMDEESTHSGNYFKSTASMGGGSNHSRHSQRNDNVSAITTPSATTGNISSNIRHLTGLRGWSSDNNAERGYFLDSDERYY
ncbi:unnamed protein product [Cylindrotheca closterium]|uniref:Uncharacterized protein n=1 Tax=Cylindrotheca closterium TaxID=2856 RepID=A0AAD2FPN8_9STRA|nr:unnamed protein product [Cylindrotheca closterium]